MCVGVFKVTSEVQNQMVPSCENRDTLAVEKKMDKGFQSLIFLMQGCELLRDEPTHYHGRSFTFRRGELETLISVR